jgi:dsDNA-specific endonuclease/ATPase MutS2
LASSPPIAIFDIPAQESVAVNQQIGIPLLLAALAALVGEVKLASNNRCADQRDRIEARIRAAQDRECTARRARIQARIAAAQCRLPLANSPRNRLQLSENLALPLEDLGFFT